MHSSEFVKRSEQVSALSEMFGRAYSVSALKAFLAATEDVPFDKFTEGIAKATKQCRFMPTPAEFRELAIGIPSAAEYNAAWAQRWGARAV